MQRAHLRTANQGAAALQLNDPERSAAQRGLRVQTREMVQSWEKIAWTSDPTRYLAHQFTSNQNWQTHLALLVIHTDTLAERDSGWLRLKQRSTGKKWPRRSGLFTLLMKPRGRSALIISSLSFVVLFFFSPLPLCLPRNVSCLLPQRAETDTETDFVVDADFTTKVDYQTTSKNVQIKGKSSHFTGSEKKQGYNFALPQEFSNRP